MKSTCHYIALRSIAAEKLRATKPVILTHGFYAKLLLFLIFLTGNAAVFGQDQQVTLSILDENSQPLLGATISDGTEIIAITNTQGKATINCQCSFLPVEISFMGYTPRKDTLNMRSESIQIQMSPANQFMEEVVVNALSTKVQVKELSTGTRSVSMENISNLPYLMGEVDPIKFIQLLPGVSTGTDGNNGFFVRGGGIDQNKILFDNIELYNTNHLFGFFSTFNALAIDRVEFTKSGYPAYQGGRLSSILHVHSTNIMDTTLNGTASLGLLAGKLHLEAPVLKGRSAIMLSGRKSYFDVITQNLFSEESEIRQRTNYQFGDLIVKYQHQISSKHQLSFTGFLSNDNYLFRDPRQIFSNAFSWYTQNAGLTWKWFKSDRVSGEVYTTFGNYAQQFQADIRGYVVSMNSGITDATVGSRNYFTANNHTFTFGGQTTYRLVEPNAINLTSGGASTELVRNQKLNSLESAVFIDDEIDLSQKWRLGLGLRVSAFQHLGPFTRYQNSGGGTITDTSIYRGAEVVKSYLGFEPRIRINHMLTKLQSIRFSYDRAFQYLHLSPLSSVSLPTDIWVPSSEKIKPQNVHQFTLGYFHFTTSNKYQFSANLFYKLLNNQMQYLDGLSFGYDRGRNFDDVFIFGRGRSLGAELSFELTHENSQFQAYYTLSRSENSFESIDEGRFFNTKYDRTHDLNLIGSHKIGPFNLSAVFKLATGNALTLPIAKYIIGENLISEYGDRNTFRMPVYHRLDISATFNPRRHPASSWVFSIYNLYNRNNPYYVYFDVQGNVTDFRLDIDLQQVALFPILPSVTYEFRF